MFSEKVNAVTGKMEWVQCDRDVTSEDSDISPELARYRLNHCGMYPADVLYTVVRYFCRMSMCLVRHHYCQ